MDGNRRISTNSAADCSTALRAGEIGSARTDLAPLRPIAQPSSQKEAFQVKPARLAYPWLVIQSKLGVKATVLTPGVPVINAQKNPLGSPVTYQFSVLAGSPFWLHL